MVTTNNIGAYGFKKDDNLAGGANTYLSESPVHLFQGLRQGPQSPTKSSRKPSGQKSPMNSHSRQRDNRDDATRSQLFPSSREEVDIYANKFSLSARHVDLPSRSDTLSGESSEYTDVMKPASSSPMLSENQVLEARESALRILKEAQHNHLDDYEYGPELTIVKAMDISRNSTPKATNVGLKFNEEASAVRKRNAALLEEISTLKIKLSNADTLVEQQNTEMEQMKKSSEQSEGIMSDLVEQMRGLETKLKEKGALKEQVRAHISSIEQDQELSKRLYSDKLRTKDDRIKELEAEVGTYEKKTSTLQEELTLSRAVTKDSRSKVEEEVAQTAKAEQTRAKEAIAVVTAEMLKTIDSLKLKMDAGKTELESSRKENNDTISKLNKELAAKNDIIEECEKANKKLVKENQTTRQKDTDTDNLLIDYENTIKSMKKKLGEQQKLAQQKDEVVTSLTKQLGAAEKSKSALEDDFCDRLLAKDEEIEKLTATMILQKQREDAGKNKFENQVLDLAKEKGKLKEQVDSNRRFMKDQENDREAILIQLKENKSQITCLQKELKNAEKDRKDAESMMKIADATIKALRKENGAAGEKMEKIEKSTLTMQKDNISLQLKLDEFKVEHDSEVSDLRSKLKESDANVSCLKRELVRSEESTLHLHEDLEKEKHTGVSLRAELRQCTSKMEQMVAQLRQEKEAAHLELKSSSRQLVQQEKELQSLLSDIDEAQRNNSTLIEELNQRKSELDRANHQLNSLEDALTKTKESFDAYTVETTDLAKAMKGTINVQKSEIDALQANNSTLRGEVNCMNEHFCIMEENAALFAGQEEMLRRAEEDLFLKSEDYENFEHYTSTVIEDLRQQSSNLTEENKSLLFEVQNLRSKYENSADLSKNLERELKRMHADSTAVDELLQSERQSIALLRNDIKDRNRTMERTLADYRKEQERLIHEIEDCSMRLTEQDRYNTDLREDLEVCKTDREELNDQVLFLDKELAAAQVFIQDAQNDADQAKYRALTLEKELQQNNDLLDRLKDSMYNDLA